MKTAKRITAGVLAAALCVTLPGMDSIKVSAGQETEEGKFTTKNLIVSTADENFDTLGAGECIPLEDGRYVLSYADEKSTESAYEAYQGMEGIDFVDINSVVNIQTEEMQEETQQEETGDASLKENPQEDAADQSEDSIKTKEETEEHPEPEEETGNQEELQKEEEISTEEPDTEQEEPKAASDTEQEEDDILRVALVDTGVKADTGNLASYIEDTGVNLSDTGDAGSTVDDNGHGTAMAQVMVSALEENGKNSDSVKILPVKVLDASGCGTTLSAYQGIKAAIGQGADIICLGFSGKAESILLEQAVNDAYETGIPVLAPAGNDGEDILAYVPGAYENAVVIGSAKNEKEADESNHGDTVDFAAYGTKEVLSLTGEKQTVKGTSVSCAYVTGVVASFPKGLSCEEMETELAKKAVPAEDESLKPYFGKGLIGDVPEAEAEEEEKEEKAEEQTEENKEKAEQEKKAAKKKTEEKSAALKKAETGVKGAQNNSYLGKRGSFHVKINNPDGTYSRIKIEMSVGSENNQSSQNVTFTATPEAGHNLHGFQIKSIRTGRCHTKDENGAYNTSNAKYRFTDENGTVHYMGKAFNIFIIEASYTKPAYTNAEQRYRYKYQTQSNGNWTWIESSIAGYRMNFRKYDDSNGWKNQGDNTLDNTGLNQGAVTENITLELNALYCGMIDSKEADVYGNVPQQNAYNGKLYGEFNIDLKPGVFIRYNANGGLINGKEDGTEADTGHGHNQTFRLSGNDVQTNGGSGSSYATLYQKRKYGSTFNLYNYNSCMKLKRKGYHVTENEEWYYMEANVKKVLNQDTDYNQSTLLSVCPNGGEVTLYANWTPNTYTVTYNGNGHTEGSTADSTHTYDTATEEKLTENGFKRKFTVTFDDNYSDDDPEEETVSSTFKHWTKKEDGSGTSYSDKQPVKNLTSTNKGTVTLYAQWKDNTVTLPSLTRTGYDLLGWNTSKTDADAGTIKTGYTPGASVTVSSTMTLYAVWKEKTYTITYNANGGTGTMEPGIKKYFDKQYTIKKNAFIREGYDFVEWNTKADGSGDSYNYNDPDKNKRYYTENADLTLYAQWRENFKAAYIGNGQTKGSDFIDEGENKLGHSEDQDYTFDSNEKKSIDDENITLAYTLKQANSEESLKSANEQFKKEETVIYEDSETGEKVEQKVSGTVVGWKMKKEDIPKKYDLGETAPGAEVVADAGEIPKALTINSPNDDYGQFREDVLPTGVTTTYGAQQGAALQNLGVGTVYNGTPYVNLYADWDMGPVIEAYDRYYTLEEAQRGFITEDVLLDAATAEDEELKSPSNPDGKLKNHKDEANNTSFVVYDYQAEEFTDLNGPAVISVTYRAEDSAGNVTRKMVKVHIVDSGTPVIDGHDIGVDPDKGEVRFISEKYLDTLDADSVWVHNPEYKALLEETVAIKRVNPERSEAPDMLKAFGDQYTVAIPGTGTWTKQPRSVWKFTHEQVKEVKAFIEKHGPSNYVEENALNTFLNEFAECKQ